MNGNLSGTARTILQKQQTRLQWKAPRISEPRGLFLRCFEKCNLAKFSETYDYFGELAKIWSEDARLRKNNYRHSRKGIEMLLKDVLKNDGLMQHRIRVEDVADRRIWLMDLCRDRSVLHVGCCDVPIFDPDNNLHIELSHVTQRLDGLDTSPEGIEVLRKHVLGDYYTSPRQVDKHYDLVLAPEVLEHTGNAHQFLEGFFGIKAGSYLITAPNIAWHEKTRRDGDIFIEQVHEDHRAWYSPYTLLNSIRPFLREEEDEVRVFLIRPTGSVAVHMTRPCTLQSWSRHSSLTGQDETQALQSLESLIKEGKTAEALFELGVLRKTMDTPRLFYLHAELLLRLQRHMDLFRISGAYLRTSPRDKKCLTYAATAAEGLEKFEEAQKLRRLIDN